MYAHEFTALNRSTNTNTRNHRTEKDRLEMILDLQENIDSGDKNSDSGFEVDSSEVQVIEITNTNKG